MASKSNKQWITLSKFDMFGVQPKFYVNNEEKYKTSWGGLLTFILFGLVVLACWVYGKDMYYREHPSTTVSEIPTSLPEKFQVTKDTFNFSFGLQGFDKINYFDESIYHLKLYQLTVLKEHDEDGNPVNKFNWRDIEAQRCKKEDFQLDSQYFITNEANFNMYCMNYDLDDVFFEGIWGSERFSMIVGRVFPCVEGVEGVDPSKCKSEEEVYKTLTDNQFSMNYSDQVINPLDYKQPFQAVGRNSYGLASWDTYRVNNFYFQNVFVEDNTGIIFDHMSQQQNLQFSYDKEFVKPGQHKDKVFLEFNLRFQSVKETKINRKYLNLAQVLANVGGILKVLMLGFALLSWIVSRQLFNLQLANQIFNFQVKEEQQNYQNNNNKNKQINEKGLYFKSYLGLLFPFCASKKTKENKKYLKFAVNKLTQRLNLNYMLEKFVEIEKIKMLLLDKDQHKLFDYIAKPMIDDKIVQTTNKRSRTLSLNAVLEETNQNQQIQHQKLFQNILLMENADQKTKRKNCLQAYKNIRSKDNQNELDKKMLTFIDEQILLQNQKHIIEKEILDINLSKQLQTLNNNSIDNKDNREKNFTLNSNNVSTSIYKQNPRSKSKSKFSNGQFKNVYYQNNTPDIRVTKNEDSLKQNLSLDKYQSQYSEEFDNSKITFYQQLKDNILNDSPQNQNECDLKELEDLDDIKIDMEYQQETNISDLPEKPIVRSQKQYKLKYGNNSQKPQNNDSK